LTETPSHREVLGIPDRRGVELALAFAKIAKKDLKASGILYEERLYPQAVFELQQVVEKGVKAVGLLLGLVRPTREDLTVAHAAIYGIVTRLPERAVQLRRTLGVLAASEGLEEGKELFLKLGLPWTVPEPAEMEARLVDEQTAKQQLATLRNLRERDLWELTLELDPDRPPNPAILKLLENAEAQWKPLDKFHRLFERKFARLMTDPDTLRFVLNVHGKAFPEVAPLAFLTMWHEKEARYPPVDASDYWDPRKYTADSGLVKVYPRLYKHARRLCDGAVAGAQAAMKI
jgi:HEPN domain-containing protein